MPLDHGGRSPLGVHGIQVITLRYPNMNSEAAVVMSSLVMRGMLLRHQLVQAGTLADASWESNKLPTDGHLVHPTPALCF